jgi:hypothetical protein
VWLGEGDDLPPQIGIFEAAPKQVEEIDVVLFDSVRLVGVSLSNFRSPEVNSEEQLPLEIDTHRIVERPSART